MMYFAVLAQSEFTGSSSTSSAVFIVPPSISISTESVSSSANILFDATIELAPYIDSSSAVEISDSRPSNASIIASILSSLLHCAIIAGNGSVKNTITTLDDTSGICAARFGFVF